jgi:chromosome segregation ATPase
METNGRLDLLAANVGEIRESRPDFSSSFFALSGLLETVQTNVTDTHDRIDALGALVRRLDDDRIDASEAIAPLAERLDVIAAQSATNEQHVTAVLESLADTFGRVDSERTTAVAQQLDEVRQAVSNMSDRQARALLDVLDRLEQVSTSVTATQDATRSVETALRSVAEDGTDERLGEFAQQLISLSTDVKSTVGAVTGLSADFTGLRADLRAFADSVPDRTDADAEVRAGLARLDEAISERDRQLRETVERLDTAVGARDDQLREAITRLDTAVTERYSDVTEGVARLDATLANRDASVRDILSRLDAAVGQTSRESDFSDLARQFDAAIGELRRDLQGMYKVVSSNNVVDMVRSMSSEVGDLRSDVQRAASDFSGGAAAALVASAASAMSRLEGRMDGEFDTVGRQMEALGTLLGQLIDAVHRVETQMVGVQPVSEKMRTSAATVLESLRASVRQRAAARRSAGGPPELGAGPR